MPCPYFRGNENGGSCKLTAWFTSQDDYQRKNYCLLSKAYPDCENYKKSDDDDKIRHYEP